MQWQPVISLSLSDIEVVSWPLSSLPGVLSYTLKDQDFMCQPRKAPNVGVGEVGLPWTHQGSRTRATVLTEIGPNMWISFRKGKSTNWTLCVAGTRTLIEAPVSVCVCDIIYCVKVGDAIPRTLVVTRGYLTYCCFSMVSSQSALYDLWPLTSTN